MNYDKAIEIVGHKGYGYPENEIREAFGMAVEAMEKQKPKKIIEKRAWHGFTYNCPNCGELVFPDTDKYVCSWCGQVLKW